MITIGIVTLDRLPLTKICIDSIIQNTPKNEYQLIVVDNKSGPDTLKYLNKLSRENNVTVINNNKNVYLGGASNQILETPTKSKWVTICANDSFFMEGWLDNFYKVSRDLQRKEFLYAKMRMFDYFGYGPGGRRYGKPKFFTTPSGGTYLTGMAKVGAGFSIKTNLITKYTELRFTKNKNMQYRNIRDLLKKLNFEEPIMLTKPCIIEQDNQFDSKNLKKYYEKVWSMKNKKKHFTHSLQHRGTWFPRDSREYKEYYDGTGYNFRYTYNNYGKNI